MRSKVKYLIKACLDKKIKTKWFKITNIILLILIVGIINLNTIVKSFGGDFDKNNTIYVSGDKTSYSTLKAYLDGYIKSADLSNYEVKYTDDIKDTKKDLEKNKKDVLIVLKAEGTSISSEVISYENIDALTYQLIEASLNSSKNIIYLNNEYN